MASRILFTTDIHMNNVQRMDMIPDGMLADSGDWYGKRTMPDLHRFTATTIGNHDAPLGYAKLKDIPNLTACNYVFRSTGSNAFAPYLLADGVLFIGVGLGTVQNKGGERIRKLTTAETWTMIKNILENVPHETSVILLHGPEATARKMAKSVPGIDIILCGHSHQVRNTAQGSTLVAQAGKWLNCYGIYDADAHECSIIKL